MDYTRYFYKQRFFFNSASVLLNFSWIDLQILLRCYLIHITIIILRHIHLVYLCPCLGLGLFTPYLCDVVFIFSLIFIVINQIISFKQTYLFFVQFLQYLLLDLDDNLNEKNQQFSNNKRIVSGCCLGFTWFFANFSLALIVKVLLIKKACISKLYSILFCYALKTKVI